MDKTGLIAKKIVTFRFNKESFFMKQNLMFIVCATLLFVSGCHSPQPKHLDCDLALQPATERSAASTSVKSQGNSPTCWAYATLSLIESVALRHGANEIDLSELWVVRYAYREKVEKYVRTQAQVDFSGGGEIQDVLDIVATYGIVPQESYQAKNVNSQRLQKEMHNLAQHIVSKGCYRQANWMRLVDDKLDELLGTVPSTFEVDGRCYTPTSYADYIGFHRDDYRSFTSFLHHPFQQECILELPDNWAAHRSYNLSIDEFMELLDNTLQAGGTIAWDGDVSEEGFLNGIATIKMETPIKNLQQLRQDAFDAQETTDDHVMHIVGTIDDTAGNRYYKVKNSWGKHAGREGYWYMTPDYIAMKSIEIVLPLGDLSIEPAQDIVDCQR
jgi:bleomycin hydrolase